MKTNKVLAQQIIMTALSIGFLGYVGYRGYQKNKDTNDTIELVESSSETKAVLEKTTITKEFDLLGGKNVFIPISVPQEGTLSRVFVSNGQQVKKGDLLVSLISSSPSEAQITRKAESVEYIASLKVLIQKIEANGVSSESDTESIEEYQTRLKKVEEALARAEVNHALLESEMHTTNLYAPVGGIVQEIQINEHTSALTNGTVLMMLKAFKSKEVSFKVNNSDYRFLLDNLEYTKASLLNDKIEAIELSEQDLKTIKAAGLDDKNDIEVSLAANSLISVFNPQKIVLTFSDLQLISVPSNAIVQEDETSYVWRVNKNGEKEKIEVDLLQIKNGKAYIRKGLNEGDSLLVLSK